MQTFTRILIITSLMVMTTFYGYSQDIFKSANMGIGTTTPSEKLDVFGNVKFSGALMPNDLPGTSGDILLSAGAGLPPSWLINGATGTVLTINTSGVPTWATPASASATAWALTGNSGTTPSLAAIGSPITSGSNFIGTTDNHDLVFALNNGTSTYERMRIQAASGAVGIDIAPVATQQLTVATSTAANIGIVGQNTAAAAAGTGVGVEGTTVQSDGEGVLGGNSNPSTSGTAVGVEGYVGSYIANSAAVWGGPVGVFGVTSLFNGTGVVGQYSGTLSGGIGVGAVTNATAATNYALYAAASGAATGGTNYAIYADASGATSNYSIVVPSGGGNVGIGTITPAQTLEVAANTIRVDQIKSGGTYSVTPSSTATVLYSNSNGDIYSLPAVDNAILATNASGVPTWSTAATSSTAWQLTGNVVGYTYAASSPAAYIGTAAGGGAGIEFGVGGVNAGRVESTNANTALGYQSLNSNTATGVTAIGYEALESNSGAQNTAVGYSTLNANAGGAGNTAIGNDAMEYTPGGTNNIAVGSGSLGANTESGIEGDVAIGGLGSSTSAGSGNTAIGQAAGNFNTGSDNVMIGQMADRDQGNGGGNDNVVIGWQAGYQGTAGSYSNFIGYFSANGNGSTVNVASYDDALGAFTMGYLTNGKYNQALGYYSLAHITSGSNNVAVGDSALAVNTTASGNVGIGSNALKATSGSGSTAVGAYTLQHNTSGTGNVAMGYEALDENTTSYNTAVGYQALSTSTQSYNTAIGYGASTAADAGYNTAVGYEALNVNTSDYNVAVGAKALGDNTSGTENSAVGMYTLILNTTGSYNDATGQGAMQQNISGSNNTAMGFNSLIHNISASNNTSVGYQALDGGASGSGSQNTAVGSNAAYNFGIPAVRNTAVGDSALYTNTNGTLNTALGYHADVASNTLTNTIEIGTNILAPNSNTMMLGNTADTALYLPGYATRGEIFYTSETSGDVAALVPGSTGTVLTIIGGVPTWQSPSGGGGTIYTDSALYTPTENTISGNGTSGNPLKIAEDGASTGQVLQWNGVTWKPVSISTGGIASVSGTSPIVVTNPTTTPNVTLVGSSGEILYGTGTSSAFTAGGTTGQVLQWNSSGVPTWVASSGGSSGWALTGNTGTTYGTNYIGTNDDQGLMFKVNSIIAGRIEESNPTHSLYASTSIGDSALYSNTTGAGNVAIGYRALALNTTSGLNTSIGYQALFNDAGVNAAATPFGTIGGYDGPNTAVGAYALYTLSNSGNGTGAQNNGSQNVAVGYQALYSDNSGSYNTAVGYQALINNVSTSGTTGVQNTAVGRAALAGGSGTNLTGQDNSGLGYQALYDLTSGNYNSGLGVDALYQQEAGSNNTAIGYYSMLGGATYSASRNTAVGSATLYKITTGAAQNVAIGDSALYSNGAATDNTGVGFHALTLNTGSQNTALGSGALAANTSGTLSTALGYEAMYSFNVSDAQTNVAGPNTAIGAQALYSNTGGMENVAVGTQSMYNSTGSTGTASYNTAVGYQTLYTTTASYYNTAVGRVAMYSETTGNHNTALGVQVMYASTTASQNVGVGENALYNNLAGGNNTAIGYCSQWNSASTYSASRNTSVGSHAMFTMGNNGDQNTAVGDSALYSNNTATDNTGVGFHALTLNSGNQNTALGSGALNANTTGTDNMALGYNANVGSGGLANATAIGANATVSTSNTIILGANTVTEVGFNGALAPYYLGAYQTGTSGQVLTSTGTGAPTWQNASGGSSTVTTDSSATSAAENTITGNGSTSYPLKIAQDNASTGQVLQWNGTTWVPASISTGGIASVSGTSPIVVTNPTTTPNVTLPGTSGEILYGTGTSSAFTTGGTAGQVLESGGTSVPTWVTLSSGGSGWQLTGNTGTTYGTNYIGTNDDQGLMFKVNSTIAGRIEESNPTHSQYASTSLGDSALYTNTTGIGNVAIGYRALALNTTSGLNTSIGYQALFNDAGVNAAATPFGTLGGYDGPNTAVGAYALYTLSNSGNGTGAQNNGSQNVAVGYQALYSDNSGSYNTAVGYQALINNVSTSGTTGVYNTAMGRLAMAGASGSNLTGSDNSGFGDQILYNLTTGNNNSAFGFNALYQQRAGSNNTAIGYWSMLGSSGGSVAYNASKNTAVGSSTLQNITTGAAQNVAMGDSALYSNGAATDNTGVGFNALTLNTGNQNTALGSGALAANTSGTLSTGLGYEAMYSFNVSDAQTNVAGPNTAIGAQALYSNTGGMENVAVGTQSMYNSTGSTGTASYNTAVGYQTLYTTTASYYNTAVGRVAMYSETTGNHNTALGVQVMYASTTASRNVGVGEDALYNNLAGWDNTAIGWLSQYNVGVSYTASRNTSVGSNAMETVGNNGDQNTAVGDSALYSNNTATDNTGVGFNSLTRNTANGNTAVGSGALAISNAAGNTAVGYNALSTNSSGTNNTALGYSANVGSGGLSNATAIGANATVSISNAIIIGANTVTEVGFNGALAPYYLGAYQTGTSGQVLTSTGTGTAPIWQAPSGGSSTVTTDSSATSAAENTITGNGSASYPLKIAQDNASTGQVLQWNGTTWVPASIGTGGIASVSGTSPIVVTNPTTTPNVTLVGSSGEILYGTGTSSAFTAGGTTGQVLQWNSSGVPTWVASSGGSSGWALTGNTGTTYGTNYIGTNDDQGLMFKVNSIIAGRIEESNPTHSLYASTSIGDSALYSNTTGAGNVAIGYRALALNTTSGLNTSIGYQALFNDAGVNAAATPFGTIGGYDGPNTAVGAYALYTLSNSGNGTGAQNNGSQNVAVGYQALYSDNSGSYNTAVGYQALINNVSTSGTTGVQNTAVGRAALAGGSGTNLTGQDNSGLGYQALYDLTSGNYNSGLGVDALYQQEAGSNNTAIGYYSMLGGATYSASRNTAVGSATLYKITTGAAQNVAIGDSALYSNGAATDNTGVGFHALTLNTGSQNTALGSGALAANTSGTLSTALGYEAMYSFNVSDAQTNVAGPNTAIGAQALYSNTGGMENVAVGTQSMYNSTGSTGTASYNTAVGYQTLYTTTASYYNTAVGRVAMYSATTGNHNTALGVQVMYASTTASQNVGVGENALYNNLAGGNNTAIGYCSQWNSAATYSASRNTSVGSHAMFTMGNNGDQNTAVGDSALYSNNTATDNTGVGFHALTLTTGNQNTALGSGTLNANTTGTDNTALGYNANVGSGGLTNATIIGANAVAVHSNTLILGDSTLTGSASAINVGINTAVPATDAGLGIKGLHLETLSGTTATTVTVNATNTGSGTGTFNATNGATGGTDVGGSIQITTGATGVSAGQMITVNFATAYKTAPAVVITPTDPVTAAAMVTQQPYVISGTNGFSINFVNTPSTSTSYNFNYFVIETK